MVSVESRYGIKLNLAGSEDHAPDVGERYAAVAAVCFGMYDDDFVAGVVAGKGVLINTNGYEGEPTVELIEGCDDCHRSGVLFDNGEPCGYCPGCEAGKALKGWNDYMDDWLRYDH